MKRYTILHPLYLSFFSRSLYQDVVRNWKGYGFAYLFLLLSLYCIPEMIRVNETMTEFLNTEAPRIVEQTPVITVNKGEASIKESVPYTIYGSEKGVPFAIIDTSGSTASLEKTKALLLVTRTKVMVRKGEDDTHSLSLAGVDHLVIDKNKIYEWIETFKGFFALVLFPFALFVSILYYTVQVIFCASAGMLFARRFNLDLKFKTLVRLAAVSYTPAILLQTAHTVLDIEFPFSGPISFFLALGYLYYAVSVNSAEEAGEVDKIV